MEYIIYRGCVNKVGQKGQTARAKTQQPAESEDRRDVPITKEVYSSVKCFTALHIKC